MRNLFLSGGTGTPKLLEGFREIVDDSSISVVCNTGDDYSWYGLHVSPDLDTVIYLFSNKLDLDKFWGVRDEYFHTLSTLKSLGEDVWFNIGNRDLGLHLFRQKYLKELNLTEISKKICEHWNIEANILPMCDQPVRSIIYTDKGRLHFQEFFVKYRWNPDVIRVEFEGEKQKMPEATLDEFRESKNIIIGPSNPITSIGPMLSLIPLQQTLEKYKDKVTAISPIIGDKAFSGPSVKLMRAQGVNPSPIGLAKYYEGYIGKMIFDPSDKKYAEEVRNFGIEPIFLPIDLKTKKQKKQLAQNILEIS